MAATREWRDRHEFLDRMIQSVSEIPIQDVVGSVVQLKPSGQHLLGLCPFHPDSHLGSFVVTPHKNIWMCFTEGIGGIKFEMMYYDLGFLDATFKLAVDFGVIAQDEYEKYSSSKFDKTAVKRLEQKAEAAHVTEKPKRAPSDICALVYSLMPKACEPHLSKADKKHLLRERALKEEDLEDYFTFPADNRSGYVRRLVMLIREKLIKDAGYADLGSFKDAPDGLKKEVGDRFDRVMKWMPFVPGFYLNSSGNINIAGNKGIGIITRDENGTPVGIQIRKNETVPGESRYVWLSSSFAIGKPGYNGGASSGAPSGVIFPKTVITPKKPAICITEGRFKAEKIAAKGNIAVFVSGVSTWKAAIPMIKKIMGKRKRAYLMFDADVMGNVAVHGQLAALAGELQKIGLDPYVIVWSKENGKGFDDLVIKKGENYATYLKTLTYQEFDGSYLLSLNEVLKLYGAETARQIKAEEADAFTDSLQGNLEQRLEIRKKMAS